MLSLTSRPQATRSKFAMEGKAWSQQIWKSEKEAGERAIGPKPTSLAFPLHKHGVVLGL